MSINQYTCVWFICVIRKLHAIHMVISFSKVYLSVQTISSVCTDGTVLNGLFKRILQANSSARTGVVKGEILSEKKDCYTRALFPCHKRIGFSECFVRNA